MPSLQNPTSNNFHHGVSKDVTRKREFSIMTLSVILVLYNLLHLSALIHFLHKTSQAGKVLPDTFIAEAITESVVLVPLLGLIIAPATISRYRHSKLFQDTIIEYAKNYVVLTLVFFVYVIEVIVLVLDSFSATYFSHNDKAHMAICIVHNMATFVYSCWLGLIIWWYYKENKFRGKVREMKRAKLKQVTDVGPEPNQQPNARATIDTLYVD